MKRKDAFIIGGIFIILIVGSILIFYSETELKNRVRYFGFTLQIVGLFIGSWGIYGKIKLHFDDRIGKILGNLSGGGTLSGKISNSPQTMQARVTNDSPKSKEDRIKGLEKEMGEIKQQVEELNTTTEVNSGEIEKLKTQLQRIQKESQMYADKTFDSKLKEWQLKGITFEVIGLSLLSAGILFNTLSPEIASGISCILH